MVDGFHNDKLKSCSLLAIISITAPLFGDDEAKLPDGELRDDVDALLEKIRVTSFRDKIENSIDPIHHEMNRLSFVERRVSRTTEASYSR